MSKWSQKFANNAETKSENGAASTSSSVKICAEKPSTDGASALATYAIDKENDSSIIVDASINEFLIIEDSNPSPVKTTQSSPESDNENDGLPRDPSEWPLRPLTRNEINQAITYGIQHYQNKAKCPLQFLFEHFDSGKARTWLLYSPAKNEFYCYVCKVFRGSDSKDRRSSLVEGGAYFHSENVLDKHEDSKQHKKWAEVYKNRKDASRNVTSFFKKK